VWRDIFSTMLWHIPIIIYEVGNKQYPHEAVFCPLCFSTRWCFPLVATGSTVTSWFVVFPLRLRYRLNIVAKVYAGCAVPLYTLSLSSWLPPSYSSEIQEQHLLAPNTGRSNPVVMVGVTYISDITGAPDSAVQIGPVKRLPVCYQGLVLLLRCLKCQCCQSFVVNHKVSWPEPCKQRAL